MGRLPDARSGFRLEVLQEALRNLGEEDAGGWVSREVKAGQTQETQPPCLTTSSQLIEAPGVPSAPAP